MICSNFNISLAC